MAKMDFAFWDSIGGRGEEYTNQTADIYDEHIRLAQRIEELGWHSYFVIEHQNASTTRVAAPAVYLSSVARATSKLRIGVMMFQLPFHNPIRLAQDVATLDQLSRGRVEVGTGIGVREHEFLRWKMNFYDRAAMSEEAIKIIKMAWTQDEVTFDGKHYQFDEALPQPKPFQKPHPPIWAAAHSDQSMMFAARNNFHVSQNLDTDEVVARKFDLYRKTWKECNHPGPMPRTFLHRPVHVAETDEKAHAQARPYVASKEGVPDAGLVLIGELDFIAKTRVGYGSHSRGMGRDSERPEDKARGEFITRSTTDYDYAIKNGLAIVGSPESVIRQLKEAQKTIGYDILCTMHEIGKMPMEMVNSSIELFGKEVIPEFK